MFNMEDILARLQNGEKIDDIGNEIAGLMNQAVAAHNAELEAEAKKQAEAEKTQAKRDLMSELVDIIKELAILEGMDENDLEITDEELDQLVKAFTEMFGAMRELKAMFASLEANVAVAPAKAPAKAVKMTPSDEQILADFIKMFN